MGMIICFECKSVVGQANEEKGMDLTVARKKEIEIVVQEHLKGVDFSRSPYVDIVSLVKRDGFIVEPRTMEMETTGLLFADNMNEDKKRLIVVNTSFKNPEKETDVVFKKSRFITAHEYGHFVLHKDLFAHRDTYHRTEPKELEADYFARSLLMPLEQFRLYLDFLRELSTDEEFVVEKLSKIFKVTKNKVRKRMEDVLALN